MFSPTYATPEASAYRAGINRHYVECAACGERVCGVYAQHGEDKVYDVDNPVLCGYRGDECFPGAMYEAGVHCHYCR